MSCGFLRQKSADVREENSQTPALIFLKRDEKRILLVQEKQVLTGDIFSIIIDDKRLTK